MATGALVSLGDYLANSYEPDCEFVDGELLERNLGESDHSGLQGAIFAWLYSRRKQLGIHVYPEMRVQISPSRFRIPDITVTTQKVKGRLLSFPPLICIEILSPEDRTSRTESKIDDYLNFGVAHVWLIDPSRRAAWSYTSQGKRDSAGSLNTTEPLIELPLATLFGEMDEEIDPD